MPDFDRLVKAFGIGGTVPDEMNTLVARDVGAVFARLTGAGFGGCVVALCQPGTDLAVPNRRWRVSAAGGAWVRAL